MPCGSHPPPLRSAGSGVGVKGAEQVNPREILEAQIKMLAEWNDKHFKEEPEQVRKNIETMCKVTDLLLARPGMY